MPLRVTVTGRAAGFVNIYYAVGSFVFAILGFMIAIPAYIWVPILFVLAGFFFLIRGVKILKDPNVR